MSFNWLIYRELNPDLVKAGLNTQQQFSKHFLLHCKSDKRNYSVYQLYPDFNPLTYKNNNSDLQNISNAQLELHWIKFGRYENRIYKNKNNESNIYNLINGIDIIYWINLDRCIERRNKMINILKSIQIPNERISASDGKIDNNIKDNFKIQLNDFKNRTNYEYACLLSHLRTITQFYHSHNNICMILEDDISMDFYKYWNKDINTVINQAPNDWEIIMLNYTIVNVSDNKTIKDLYTCWNPEIYSTLSYIINRKGVSKIMNIFKNNKWILNDFIHTADYVIYNNCKTYAYKYCYFTVDSNIDSTIHSDHIGIHTASKNYSENLWINNKNN